MRVMVTGGRGMLGVDVCRTFQAEGHEVLPVSTVDFDLTDSGAVIAAVKSLAPELIIHTAAFTDVDGCERDPEKAYRVNAIGSWNIAAGAESVGAALVVISTDFVFDGAQGRPYTEFDATHPLGAYGGSKLEGERLAAAACPHTYIVRTSWLYGLHGKCFPATILRLAETRPEIKIVADQIGSPTYAVDLARTIADIVALPLYGMYHVANSGQCSWRDFAAALLSAAGRPEIVVTPISASSWPSPTTRPSFSVLRGYVRELQGKPPLRPWQEALADYVAGLKSP